MLERKWYIIYQAGERCDQCFGGSNNVELNNTRATEFLSMMECGPEIVSNYQYDTPPCMRGYRETACRVKHSYISN